VSPDVALGGFHAYSGSLLFAAVALVLASAGGRSRFFSVSASAGHPTLDCAGSERTAASRARADVVAVYVLPLLLIIATGMLGSVVTVPIAEELAFRGYLARRLVTADFERLSLRHFSWLAFIGSSVLFGAMHSRLIAGTLTGALYFLCFRRRGELADSILAHAITNGLIAAYVVTTGNWVLWA
jgi:CAAX prenyl protease-like protein